MSKVPTPPAQKSKRKVSLLLADQIMTHPAVIVKPTMTIIEIMNLFVAQKISGAPIVDHNNVVISVVTEADLMKFAATDGLNKRIVDFFDRLCKKENVVCVLKKDDFKEIFRKFLVHPVRRVIVTDNSGRLQGVISRRNILKAFLTSEGVPVKTPTISGKPSVAKAGASVKATATTGKMPNPKTPVKKR